MNTPVLVVEADCALGRIWCSHLERMGALTRLVSNEEQAIKELQFQKYSVIILDLVIPRGSAIAISDFATYKNPNVSIIMVTSTNFFSDGSIFEVFPNARTCLRSPVKPDDLAALVEHCGRRAS